MKIKANYENISKMENVFKDKKYMLEKDLSNNMELITFFDGEYFSKFKVKPIHPVIKTFVILKSEHKKEKYFVILENDKIHLFIEEVVYENGKKNKLKITNFIPIHNKIEVEEKLEFVKKEMTLKTFKKSKMIENKLITILIAKMSQMHHNFKIEKQNNLNDYFKYIKNILDLEKELIDELILCSNELKEEKSVTLKKKK